MKDSCKKEGLPELLKNSPTQKENTCSNSRILTLSEIEHMKSQFKESSRKIDEYLKKNPE